MFIVVGKEGYIAKRCVAELQKGKFDFAVTSLEPVGNDIYLDLLKVSEFDFSIISKDDIILFLAGISSPDICTKEYDFAYKVNVSCSRQYIEKFIKRGAKVLFFSSDVVYGNVEEVVDENSLLNPIGQYAQMKKEIEDCFKSEKNFKVFRQSYVFSKDDKFTSYLCNCSKHKRVAEVYSSLARCVVYINNVIEAIISLSGNWEKFENQVFNLCGPELLDRVWMAQIYKSVIDNKLRINTIEPSRDFFLDRPKVINMKSIYLNKLLAKPPRSFLESMKAEFATKKG